MTAEWKGSHWPGQLQSRSKLRPTAGPSQTHSLHSFSHLILGNVCPYTGSMHQALILPPKKLNSLQHARVGP
jgi:hypothetical protein